MTKKVTFLLTFFVTLLLILGIGFLMGDAQEQNNFEEVKHFAPNGPSINTSTQESSEPEVPAATIEPVQKKQWYNNQVVVLTYHHVANETKQMYVISPEQFAKQMAFLYENDLHPISLTEFTHFVDTGVLATDNAVLITFDDGYESYYTNAFPILKKYDFPSVAFPIVSRLRDAADRKRLNMTVPLNHQELEEMLASGLVEVGSHTYSLHEQNTKNEWGELGPETAPVYLEDLNRLEHEQEYRNRLYVDFTMSRVGISELIKKPVETISYPFGYSNDIVTDTAKQAGYKYAFNMKPGVVTQDVNPFEIPRFDVGLPDTDVASLEQLFTNAKTNAEGSDHEEGN